MGLGGKVDRRLTGVIGHNAVIRCAIVLYLNMGVPKLKGGEFPSFIGFGSWLAGILRQDFPCDGSIILSDASLRFESCGRIRFVGFPCDI
jgi:hypothetical protein